MTDIAKEENPKGVHDTKLKNGKTRLATHKS